MVLGIDENYETLFIYTTAAHFLLLLLDSVTFSLKYLLLILVHPRRDLNSGPRPQFKTDALDRLAMVLFKR